MLETYPLPTNHPQRGGGRVSSPAYRQSLTCSDDFTGLEEGIDRYELLLLVKRVGKTAGFTPRMMQLLDYYFAFTREIDWEQGSRPIVYQSLSRTALDLGVSERQVQKLEKGLFELGACTWSDSGNHKRYGQRDQQTGRILYAYGVDLTPLAYLREKLQDMLQEKQLHDQAWLACKREISFHRRQIRSLLLEWQLEEGGFVSLNEYEKRYEKIAIQLRTHLDLETMRTLLARHQSLHNAILEAMGVGEAKTLEAIPRRSIAEKTDEGTCTSEPEFAHYKYTTLKIKKDSSRADEGLQGSVAAPPEASDPVTSSGLAHISLGMAIAAASERLQQLLPPEPTWPDLIEAAYRLRTPLGISQASWGEACEVLGRTGAALCLLVTDRATERTENAVEKPAAYFRGMVNKSKGAELRLHNSVFGLLKSSRESLSQPSAGGTLPIPLPSRPPSKC
jgi:replication initiation protein RepC